MNKVIIIGGITNDLELRKTQGGTSVVDFSIAVNEKSKGETYTDFFEVEAFGTLAENIKQYCSKGSKVLVEGKLKTSSYKNKEGVNVRKVFILASSVEFLSTKKAEGLNIKSNNPSINGEQISPDELPFF